MYPNFRKVPNTLQNHKAHLQRGVCPGKTGPLTGIFHLLNRSPAVQALQVECPSVEVPALSTGFRSLVLAL